MRLTLPTLVAFACLCGAGCKPALLPASDQAHKLAADAEVDVWVREASGALRKQRVRFIAGDFCATAAAVEADK